MSSNENRVQGTPTVAAPRRCAFYQAEMAPTARATEKNILAVSALTHRCLINAGKTSGPDGNQIGPTACTPDRQSACQTSRRQALMRLHATLPSMRSAA